MSFVNQVNKIILLAYLCLFCVGFMENSRGAYYLDFINLFNISNSTGSLLFSISSLSSFMATVLSKYWLYKITSIKASKIAMFLLFFSSFLFYVITSKYLNFNFFLLINILYGAGIGILSITVNNLICENVVLENRSRYLLGLHSMYGLSSLVAPYIVSGLFLSNIDWRYIYLFLGGFSLIIFLVSFKIRSQKNHLNNINESLFANKKLYCLIGLAGSLYVASEVLISTRLVVYLVNSTNMDKIVASYLLTLFFAFLFLGRLFTSFINLKIEKIRLLKFSLMISILILILGIHTYPPLLALSALSMSYFFPLYMGFISESFEDYQKDLMAKLMNFIGAMLFISHGLFGVISDSYGLSTAMYLPVLFLLISLYILHSVLQKYVKFGKKYV